MANLPKASELIDNNVTEGQFKLKLTQLVTGIDRSYKTLAEANLDISNISVNTKVEVLSEIDGGSYEKSSPQATTLTRIKNDVDDRLQKFTLVKIDQSNADIFGEKSDLNAMFIFEDVNGDVIAIMKPDGNILTARVDLHKSQDYLDFLNQFKSSIENSNNRVLLKTSRNLFDFEDSAGNRIISFKRKSVIELEQGINISKSSFFSGEKSKGIYAKEHSENEYLNLNLQRLLLSNVSTLSPFVGSHKQKFSIKNPSDFLNLKISQGDLIPIDTPYYKKDSNVFSNQVVHPYICKFNKTVMGYNWIVLLTPFHSTNDMYENPCVYGSNDLKNFELIDTFDQPLMNLLPTGEYNYNSDPSCVFDHNTGEFCVISRNTQALSGSSLYVLRTKDFVGWSEPELIDIEDGLSPSIMFDTSINKWVLYSYYDNESFSRKVADKLEGPWVVSEVITPPFNVWHQEIRFCGTHYVGVFGDNKLNTGGALYLGISTDGINWQFSGDIFDGVHLPAYKPSITHEFVDQNHIKFHIVWTSSDISGVLSEKWKLFSAETQTIEVI